MNNFLLIMPDYEDFQDLFIENLKYNGWKTKLLTTKTPKFEYKKNERLINFFKKTFFKDKTYKKNLVNTFKTHFYINELKSYDLIFDYVLIIRPDLFPLNFIKSIKSFSKKTIGYQWDGLHKFPEVKEYITFFDSFYCFEKSDEFPSVKTTTNFYFDHKEENIKPFNFEYPVLYFVGLFWTRREDKINNIVNQLSKLNIDIKVNIQVLYDKPKTQNPKIKYFKNRISFNENIENVIQSDILLDVIDPIHKGLSIRFFEGMYYKKKVITDNIEVEKYDFYHPNNIFVIKNDNFEQINEFIKKPYIDNHFELKKYGFTLWLNNILNN